MSEEENGTLLEQPAAPPPIGLNMQLNPQGVVLSFPVNLSIDNETMKQLVKAYLQAHPELVQEIAREALVQKQQEMKFLQMVKQSRTD